MYKDGVITRWQHPTPFASHLCNGDGAVESFTNLPTTDGTQKSLISRTGRPKFFKGTGQVGKFGIYDLVLTP